MMPDQPEDIGIPKRGPGNRHPGTAPEYGLIPREQLEYIIERYMREQDAKFRTEAEIIKLIDQRTARRWRNIGMPVSANADEPGAAEDKVKAMIDYLGDLTADSVARKGYIGRRLTQIAAILGGTASFLTFVYLLYSSLAHVK